MAQRETIDDYRMVRVRSRPRNQLSSYRFLRDVLDPQPDDLDDWEDYLLNDTTGDVEFSYSISVTHRTLIVRDAQFKDADVEVRFTDMRAWQAIVDCWLAGHPDQPAATVNGLRYLAFESVYEPASKRAMNSERDQQVSDGKISMADVQGGQPVVIPPGGTSWTNNTWIRCSERVAENLSLDAGRQIKVTRAVAVYPEQSRTWHPSLVVELTPVEAP